MVKTLDEALRLALPPLALCYLHTAQCGHRLLPSNQEFLGQRQVSWFVDAELHHGYVMLCKGRGKLESWTFDCARWIPLSSS